jgi:hypothetical protein
MRETRAKASQLEGQRRIVLGELARILAKRDWFPPTHPDDTPFVTGGSRDAA